MIHTRAHTYTYTHTHTHTPYTELIHVILNDRQSIANLRSLAEQGLAPAIMVSLNPVQTKPC